MQTSGYQFSPSSVPSCRKTMTDLISAVWLLISLP
ncbi:hypothetical protein SLEP1_g56620 [Rubroshorea leprosula]|uniref:Uncharacterized protein n=1 Tax=Rubroshorea leprosula TaxID=152421 RepID=A0AAV5MMR8_9ROSI|nr:hypothetical protein SLEP1_g56620 [Rubroshorea leprosula]